MFMVAQWMLWEARCHVDRLWHRCRQGQVGCSSLMFRPSPCPRHYAGRWATMPSADFCLITVKIAPAALPFVIRFARCWRMTCQNAQTFSIPAPVRVHDDRWLSRSPRIRT
ncbi:hypothetical protein [Thiothrix subterranea]|uniref:Uncharacterized protein n=1 Tax=Thiothrix subterranea TaxID=2735563 RepID=A0AA51MI47_9GAMM|nr:hypothetical protein [Thiothrix subterranea]WML84919.1 hypothetical protein RCG00_00370 [Thiothrix subterranea]